jgi:hypothetical protein
MTLKEKAKALVDRFYNEVKYMERAKVCALIAVDEIIDSVYDEHVSDILYQYWEEVKQEIKKL